LKRFGELIGQAFETSLDTDLEAAARSACQ
jgi:hypothetical protein